MKAWLAQKGPTKRAKEPAALLRPRICPWRCGSAVREIKAPTLGQATDWPTAVTHIRSVVTGRPVENGCSSEPRTVSDMPAASMRPSP